MSTRRRPRPDAPLGTFAGFVWNPTATRLHILRTSDRHQSRTLRQAVVMSPRPCAQGASHTPISHVSMAASKLNSCTTPTNSPSRQMPNRCRLSCAWASAHRCSVARASATDWTSRRGRDRGHERGARPIEGGEESPRRAKAPASPGRLPRRAPARTWESSRPSGRPSTPASQPARCPNATDRHGVRHG
jgi:hypothetical protein